MYFEEPKVVFVSVDVQDIITASGDGPSMETCDGVEAPSNVCANFME